MSFPSLSNWAFFLPPSTALSLPSLSPCTTVTVFLRCGPTSGRWCPSGSRSAATSTHRYPWEITPLIEYQMSPRVGTDVDGRAVRTQAVAESQGVHWMLGRVCQSNVSLPSSWRFQELLPPPKEVHHLPNICARVGAVRCEICLGKKSNILHAQFRDVQRAS